jgi:hypothetical protein
VVDTVDELVDGMRDMRLKSAVLVSALRKLGGALEVTHSDAYESARFNVNIRQVPGALLVSLSAAPVHDEALERAERYTNERNKTC